MCGALFQTDKWEMNELPGGYDLNSALKTQCWYVKNVLQQLHRIWDTDRHHKKTFWVRNLIIIIIIIII